MLSQVISRLRNASRKIKNRTVARAAFRRKLFVESLEDRRLLAGLVYRSANDYSDHSFAVFNTATNVWTNLGTANTGTQMAVSSSGDLFMLNRSSGAIQLYNQGANVWSNVMASPFANQYYANLEVTDSQQFFFSRYSSNQLSYTTAPGVWSSITMPEPLLSNGDYDSATNSIYLGALNSSKVYRVDVTTLAISSYSFGATGTGELKRFGEILSGTWYAMGSSGTDVLTYNLSSTSNAQVIRTLPSSVGFYPSAATDVAENAIYITNLYNSPPTFVKWNPTTNILTTLADASGSYYHSSLAFVPTSAGTLSAVFSGGALTITDTDVTGKNNVLTASRSGSILSISDANERFQSAPAGGTLGNGNKTLSFDLSVTTISGISNFKKAANKSPFRAVCRSAPRARWMIYWLQPQ